MRVLLARGAARRPVRRRLKTTVDNMGRRIAAREQISEYVVEYDGFGRTPSSS